MSRASHRLSRAVNTTPRRHHSSTAYTMENAQTQPQPGDLSWRLSSHPITLLTFLFFRICECLHRSPGSKVGLLANILLQQASLSISSASNSSPKTSTSCLPNQCAEPSSFRPPPTLLTYPPTSSPLATHQTNPQSLQRPYLHNHHAAPGRRFLLPEKHRRAPARRAALVERSGHGDGRLALGLRVRRPGNPHHQRHRQALLLARAVRTAGPMGHPRYCGAG
jgi:hypothetical protein